MEQHALWTETVRDILLSPLQCCLTSDNPDEAGFHPLTEGPMAGMSAPSMTEITETTRLLDQPRNQQYGPNQKEQEQEKGQSYKLDIADAPDIIVAPKPVSVFPLFDGFDREYRDAGDAEVTDDQDDQTDPFEFDNAPEYREILGHTVTVATAPVSDLNALPVEPDEENLARDLITLRRMLELGLMPLGTDWIEEDGGPQ